MKGIPNTPVVSFRTLNYEQMVQEMWGPAWNMNDIAYEMSNGRKFESTDRYTTGVYSAHLGAGGRILILPLSASAIKYPDMSPTGFISIEPGNSGYILQEP